MIDLNKSAALVVLSGGQDSSTCLYWAKSKFEDVYAITFDYGQRHKHEVELAREMAQRTGVPFKLMSVPLVGALSATSLTREDIEVDEEVKDGQLPNTFVPGRNLFFLSIAAVYAREIGAMNIVTGVSQTDFSGYPDCRDSFIKSLNVTLNLAMDEQFCIHTPLMWLDKAETWEMADSLGVFDIIKNNTLTCYNGVVADGCGNCPACKLRKKGLEEYLQKRGR